MTTVICHNCQRPISAEKPTRTVSGEPAHPDCVVDITPGDVEGARERLLDADRLDSASEEYRSGWIEATIAMDLLLTDPDAVREQPYGTTD